VRILLTGIGCPGGHALITNLKLQEPEMFILGTNAHEQAVGSRMCDAFEETPWAYEKNYVNTIIELVKEYGIDIVFPQTSWEMFELSKAGNKVRKHCRLLASDHELVNVCENKYLMYEHLKGKMDLPKYYLVNTIEELEEAAAKLGYPENNVVFKPPVGKGNRGVRVMTEKADRFDLLFNGRPFAKYISLDELRKTVEGKELPELMVMEYLDGREYKVNPVLVKGKMLICSVKDRLNYASGLAMGFEVISHDESVEYGKEVMKHIPMDYCVDIQLRGGVLMEINPRVSTFIYDENYCPPYLALKLAMEEMTEAEVERYQKNVPIGKKMFRYYGQVDY